MHLKGLGCPWRRTQGRQRSRQSKSDVYGYSVSQPVRGEERNAFYNGPGKLSHLFGGVYTYKPSSTHAHYFTVYWCRGLRAGLWLGGDEGSP